MERDSNQLSIETPELVDLEMPLAGIGSRFIALLIDYLVWLALLVLGIVGISLLGPSMREAPGPTSKWAIAVVILIPFLIFWGYFTLFEAFWGGRTPGKRVARIRVIQRSGRGISLFEAMTRNLLRIVDQFPLIYGVGIASMFLTRQHQRLGDLAAGTLVVHDREQLTASSFESHGRIITPMPTPPSAVKEIQVALPGGGYPVERLRVVDLEVLENFFARRLDLPESVRTHMAERIAAGLRERMGLPTRPEGSTERFLEHAAKQLREVARALPE
jgi:uncharacterized RDD family membrane protein YckC